MVGWPRCRNLVRCFVVELRKLSVERYKGYAQRQELEFAPLTILVGANNAGKTALAQSIPLLAGGLSPEGADVSEPLPLESGGVRHGTTFADLVTGRSLHGRLHLSAALADGQTDFSIAASVQAVQVPPYRPGRQVYKWRLARDGTVIELTRSAFDDELEHVVDASGMTTQVAPVRWRRLIPELPRELVASVRPRLDALQSLVALQSWAHGIRYLQCPRKLGPSLFLIPDAGPAALGSHGEHASLLVAANDELEESVRKWYRRAFGTTLNVGAQGTYSELLASAPHHTTNVPLTHSGRGLAQVLPVAVMALTSRSAGPGVDIVEHPEAELHPASHAYVAELLLENLAGHQRPLVVETHSEMLLLRARRWIAEGRLPADHVRVYWIHVEQGSGSVLREIGINEKGEVDNWPSGVFVEDYEEILAIRRARRTRG